MPAEPPVLTVANERTAGAEELHLLRLLLLSAAHLLHCGHLGVHIGGHLGDERLPVVVVVVVVTTASSPDTASSSSLPAQLGNVREDGAGGHPPTVVVLDRRGDELVGGGDARHRPGALPGHVDVQQSAMMVVVVVVGVARRGRRVQVVADCSTATTSASASASAFSVITSSSSSLIRRLTSCLGQAGLAVQRAGAVVQRAAAHRIQLHLRVVVHSFERLNHRDAVGEDAVGEEEGVEEVDAEEAQVGEALEEALRRGVPNLRQLAAVQRPREANVHVVLEEPRIVSGTEKPFRRFGCQLKKKKKKKKNY
ncbi:hypothetical protein TYRP_013346 [Tyrophagus putrescentiae]|nr:hypothetical protein TYRP_013346 [Tyrophagus putrescentiae]